MIGVFSREDREVRKNTALKDTVYDKNILFIFTHESLYEIINKILVEVIDPQIENNPKLGSK